MTGSRGVRWFVGCLLAKDHRKSTTIPYPRPDGQHMMDALQPLSRVTQLDCQLETSRHRPDLLCIASSDQSVDQNRRGRLSAMRWECGASGKRATSVCRPAIVLIPEDFVCHEDKKGLFCASGRSQRMKLWRAERTVLLAHFPRGRVSLGRLAEMRRPRPFASGKGGRARTTASYELASTMGEGSEATRTRANYGSKSCCRSSTSLAFANSMMIQEFAVRWRWHILGGKTVIGSFLPRAPPRSPV